MKIYIIGENLLTCCFELIMLKSFSKALLHNRRKRDELFNPAAVVLTLGLAMSLLSECMKEKILSCD